MQKDNRASNAIYLGEFIAGIIQRAPEDQYRPMPQLFVEETEPEPDPEELPDNVKDILKQIKRTSPDLFDRVKRIFKNAGS